MVIEQMISRRKKTRERVTDKINKTEARQEEHSKRKKKMMLTKNSNNMCAANPQKRE